MPSGKDVQNECQSGRRPDKPRTGAAKDWEGRVTIAYERRKCLNIARQIRRLRIKMRDQWQRLAS